MKLPTFNVDLHTHSTASPDGGLSRADYERVLGQGILDYVAVTDHGTTDMARELHDAFGERVIIGQEIMTLAGEIIGLYLQTTIPAGLTPHQAVAAIRQQGGLVYIPHPFETVRHGLQADSLASIVDDVDIIEAYNGRAVFQNKSQLARQWASAHNCAIAASSDSHGAAGWGRTYTRVSAAPDRDNLVSVLRQATCVSAFPGLRAIMAPKINRLARLNRSRKQVTDD